MVSRRGNVRHAVQGSLISSVPVLGDGVLLVLHSSVIILPADRGLAVLLSDLRDSIDKVHVVVMSRHVGLIAAHMDIHGGRDLGNLTEHLVNEDIGILVAALQRGPAHIPALIGLGVVIAVGMGLAVLGGVQHGHGNQSRPGVGRHIKLGNDLHVPLCGVGHDVLELLLGIVSGSHAIVVTGGGSTQLRQVAEVHGIAVLVHHIGVILDLQAPALVITQVHVQLVDLILGHVVDLSLYLFYREKMAGHIQVHTTIPISGLVRNVRTGSGPGHVADQRVALDLAGEHLAQRLQAVIHAACALGGDGHTVCGDGQLIAFLLCHSLTIQADDDISALAFLTLDHRQVIAGGLAEFRGHHFGRVCRLLIGLGQDKAGLRLQGKVSLGLLILLGQRNDGTSIILLPCCQGLCTLGRQSGRPQRHGCQAQQHRS